MTSRDFVYWLQGFFEVGEPYSINQEQTEMIKKHLALVFVHEIDPSYGDKKHQDKLNAIHKPSKENVETLEFVAHKLNNGRNEDGVVYRC